MTPTSAEILYSAVLGDLDNDGLDDVITSSDIGVVVMLADENGTLTSYPSPELGDGVFFMAVADFNGDDFLDLAFEDARLNRVSVSLGYGNGTFSTPTITSIVTSDHFAEIVAADMDGDGFQDLIVGGYLATPTLTRGRGDGTFFSSSIPYPIPSLRRIRIGDFDGDGAPDLAGNGVILFNDNNGGVIEGDGSFVSTAGVGDINGDGFDDIVGNGDNTFVTMFGQATRTLLGPLYHPLNAPEYNSKLALARWNGDAFPDVITASTVRGINLYTNNGNGTYAPVQRLLSASGFQELMAGHINDDGITDLVAVDNGGVSVFLGIGNGRLAGSRSSWIASEGATDVALADFDNDDLLDAVVAHETGLTFFHGTGVLLGTRIVSAGPELLAIAAADLDGDGNLDVLAGTDNDSIVPMMGDGAGNFQQAAEFPSITHPREVLLADFDMDEAQDLLVVGNQLAVHRGKGESEFDPVELLDEHASDAVVGEFNSDGFPDVAIANFYDDVVTIFYGGQSSLLTEGPSFPTDSLIGTESGPTQLTCADFNFDGNDDLAVNINAWVTSIPVTVPNGGRIQIFLGDGNGTFTKGAAYDGENGSGLTAADTTGDGIPDLLYAAWDAFGSAEDVSIYQGKADGTFEAPGRFVMADTHGTIATGDINGDGINDICRPGNEWVEVLSSTVVSAK